MTTLADVSIDEMLCSATANCVAIAPELFEVGEDGVARLRVPHIDTPEALALAEEAAECCPLTAIAVHRKGDR